MKKIYWDKGHRNNIHDYGAVGNGLREADLVNRIVEYAMAYLEANYTGFQERTNRKGNEVISLKQRTDQANAWGADVYISVHINAGGGEGFESFVYPGVNAATISLQNMLHDEIMFAMREFGQIQDRGKKRGNYHVLRETNMPAVLTENLFIDSTDSRYLKNEAFLKAIGEAHARAVAKYLGLPKKPVAASAGQAVPYSAEPLKKMLDKGIIQGYPDGSLRENEPISMARLSIILDNLGLLD